MRVSMGIDVGAGQAEELDDILRPWGVGPRFGDHWLRFDSIGEFAVDGSGLIDSTPALFRRGILTIHRHGWRPAPHIGTEDKYLDQALEAYEAADRDRPIRDERWIVEHVPQTRPDQMDRMARLGVTAVVNLAGYRETGTLIKTYGQARVERIVPVREMLDHRVNVVFGSDWSDGPNNPFVPFYYYTTRKTEDGAVLGPAQAISRQEALRLLTMNPAYVARLAARPRGGRCVGKRIDDLQPRDDPREDDVVRRQRIVGVHDEELAPVGVRPCIRHRDDAPPVPILIEARTRVDLVRKGPSPRARSAGAVP